MWHVRRVVGENGAFYFSYDRLQHSMRQHFAKDEEERKMDRKRLDQVKRLILERVAGVGISSDKEYRIADLAIDYCEDVPSLSSKEIQKIVRIFEDNGATAKVSSIHVNGWFGGYDKLSMTKTCLHDLFGVNSESDNDKVAFIGDSPNDSPMFSYFRNSIGVANAADFDLQWPPNWITDNRSSRGFVEFTELLLDVHGF
jgi:hydroxymethylpyrimidine pyrophosphatase-like HAD family hydrolase